LKELTRTNSAITAESISAFIDTLEVNDSIKAELEGHYAKQLHRSDALITHDEKDISRIAVVVLAAVFFGLYEYFEHLKPH
jgi:hypothetical protein